MATDPLTWSHQATMRHKSSGNSLWEVRRAVQSRGPVLGGDDIVVPSEFYNRRIATFFAAQGFHYKDHQWKRDTRRPYQGRIFSAAAWLRATRRKFNEIWAKEKTQ